MSYQKLANGTVIKVESLDQIVVSQEDLQAVANELTAKLSEVNALINNSPTITIPGTDGSYTPPAENAQPASTEPTQPEQPVPADPNVAPAPAEPQPAAQPEQPAPAAPEQPQPGLQAEQTAPTQPSPELTIQ